MQLSDLKYVLAYILPISSFFAINAGGSWPFAFMLTVFILIPLLEYFIPVDTYNQSAEIYDKKEVQPYFDWLLFLNIPIVFGLLIFSLNYTQYLTDWKELLPIILVTGFVFSANGINVAHELGHKPGKLEQFSAKLLYLPSLYMHFIIEHNLGHHVRVATPEDPATSRKNEIVYLFWFRSVIGSYKHAWELEKRRLNRKGKSFFSLANEMLIFQFIQLGYLATIFFFFGLKGMLLAIAFGVVSFLFLETINYIEHYGLQRKKLANGRYETVEEIHSWNSDHQIGRILLYELTRHSDHHYKAAKPYQTLLHYETSPQLPLGYPGSVMLSLLPPIWFMVMNPKVDAFNSLQRTIR